jgi:hypothetical protein
MSKKIKAVRPEILRASPDSVAETYKRMIEQVVEERIAELMADKESEEFRPFFETAEVAQELRRRMSVTEDNKWRYYFEAWGCLVCERTDVSHRTLGMCARCYANRRKRLSEIRKEHATDPVIPDFDSVAKAQRALLPSIKALAKKRRSE